MSNPIPIEDFASLAKLVDSGAGKQVLAIHETTHYENGSPEQAIHVGAIASVSTSQVGETKGSTTIWLRNRPEPIVIPRVGAGGETQVEVAWQMIAGL